MREINAAPSFSKPVVFPDVDAAVLAREESSPQVVRPQASSGAWTNYLWRTLPPRPTTRSSTSA